MADIGIVGVGIIGLTSALVLQRAGHDVHIYSREDLRDTTSWAAGAISYPFAIEETKRSLNWFLRTNEVLKEMSEDFSAGIDHVQWRKFSEHDSCEHPFWLDALDGKVLSAKECPDPYQSGITAHLPMIAVQHYYPYLFDLFEKAGGSFTLREFEALEDVPTHHDIVINASGIGARQLCDDSEIYPACGQTVVVKNRGVKTHTALFDKKFYIYPRREQVLLGGCYIEHEWSREVDEGLTLEILDWAKTIDPLLADPEILEVNVGLRPVRSEVRLEADVLKDGRAVIHNYGHGGCGYTVSWGCAEEVLKLVETL